MKKIVFAALTLLSSVIGFAQTDGPGTVTIKPAIGFNVTDFSKAPPGGESKAKLGWQAGGTVLIGNKVYVEPGFFYTQRSTKFVGSNTSVDNVKLDYSGFYIPVAIGANLLGDEHSFVSVHAIGGMSAFFKTGNSSGFKDQLKNAEYGVFAGAGVNVGLLFIDAKYEWSLTNIQKDVSTVDVGKSRSLFINAGLRFRL